MPTRRELPDWEVREELYRLASSTLCGEASAEEVQRLESLVTGSAAARRSYAEFICGTSVICGPMRTGWLPKRHWLRRSVGRRLAALRPEWRSGRRRALRRLLDFFLAACSVSAEVPARPPWIAAATCAAVAAGIFLWSRTSDVRPHVTPNQAAVENKTGGGPQRGEDAEETSNAAARLAEIMRRSPRRDPLRWPRLGAH